MLNTSNPELQRLASPEAIIMLTSTGPSTDALKDAARDTFPENARNLRIVRLKDGWQSFQSSDSMSGSDRLKQLEESLAARIWSRAYLKYVFGKNIQIETVEAGQLTPEDFEKRLNGVDLLAIPGGNTSLTARGLKPHTSYLRDTVNRGELPILTESAGSIYAGLDLSPGDIEPADPKPQNFTITAGLGLVTANVIVHAPGRTQSLAVPRWSKISDREFRKVETPSLMLDEYIEASVDEVLVLHDGQAAVFASGEAQYVE